VERDPGLPLGIPCSPLVWALSLISEEVPCPLFVSSLSQRRTGLALPRARG
jgi:hypothetical protein